MRKKTVFRTGLALLFLFSRPFLGKAQFSLTGQLRTRTETRDGYGTLETIGSKPAFLTSQRTRITFNYSSHRVIFQAAVQDIRVWGADASTINNADGNRLSVHEAWGELILANAADSSFTPSGIGFLSVKIGRQELVYDDQRLLGNLDWLQQARRHDAIVFKLLHHGWQADLGAAFNQNTDAVNYNGTSYTPANIPPYAKDSKGNLTTVPSGLVPLANGSGLSARNGAPLLAGPAGTNGMNQDYKAMQFLYLAKKFRNTRVSGLVLADEFGKYRLDSVKNIAGSDTGTLYGRRFDRSGVNTRITAGILLTSQLDKQKKWLLTAGFYYQSGKDKDGFSIGAYTSTFSLTHTMGNFSGTAGWDYVRGGFDPLYGTPHKFWGTMDYFYAATGAPAGGLNNPFLKAKYTAPKGRFTIGLDYHYFALAMDQKDLKGNSMKKFLGSEFDLTASYSLNKITWLEGGFSRMMATSSMELAKGLAPGTTRLNGNWAWLQVNIRPDFLH